MRSAVKHLYPDGIAPHLAQNYYMGFPVFLVAFTLVWSGVLGFAQYIWARESGLNGLVSVDTAIVYLLCGIALIFARSNVLMARIMAFAVLAASVVCVVIGTSTEAFFEGVKPFDLPLRLEGGRAIMTGALALCIACCTFGSIQRQLARWVAVTIIVVVIMTHFAASWFPMRFNPSDTDSFGTLLLVLTAFSVVTLSRRDKQAFVCFNKTVALTGILGALVAVLTWYALAALDRHSVRDQAFNSSAHVAQTLSRTVNDHLELMARMSLRWESLGTIPSLTLREQELSSYLHDIEAIDLIAITDSSQLIRSYKSRDASSHQWLAERRNDADYLAIIAQAHRNAAVHIGVVDGRSIIVAPMTTVSLKDWAIVAIYDEAKLVAQSLAPNPGQIKIRVSQDRQLIHDQFDSSTPIAFISELTMLPYNGYARQVSAWYQYREIPSIASQVPDLVFLLLLIFTYLLTRSQKIASMLFVRSKELRHSLLHDSLTGLPNTRYLVSMLTAACDTATKSNTSVSVLLINLSGIKVINASVGERAGDEVVREAAQRISNETGDQGVVTRLIGDNFVVVITGYSADDIRKLMIRIIDRITRPYHSDGGDRSLTSNVGMTVSNGNLADPLELVREARLALAHARRKGRNVWYEYSPELNEAFSDRLELRNKLRAAIDADALALHYQPIIDGQSERIVAIEALLRWNDPELGYISPAVFVPLAEAMEMIIPLTEWVLARACRDIEVLRSRNLLDFPVQINISSQHFVRDDFIHSIRSNLADHSLPGTVLAIEITEGILLNNVPDAIRKLQELKALGIKASIDDFGTGYSSLSYLRRLPIDKIKIDKSFIANVVTDQHDATLVRAIISLAHNLGIRVVAEGVETEPQYWFLRRQFCDEFQGYLFARPMPRDELEDLLLKGGSRHSLPQAHSTKDSARTLLLLDDEENILRALKRLLRQDGYHILTARSCPEAFTLLAENNVQVIVSDQRMPEMNGTEFFSAVKQMYPDTVRLILSGYTDLKSVTDAINHGAIYKFLTKPWDDKELRAEIARAFRVGPG